MGIILTHPAFRPGSEKWTNARVVAEEPQMETSDEWIQQRTGIKSLFRCAENEGALEMLKDAVGMSCASAGIEPGQIDAWVHGTLASGHYFPDLVQMVLREFGVVGPPAYGIRNQCSNFLYSLWHANALIRTYGFRRMAILGSEVHARGTEASRRNRHVRVIFGDAASSIIAESCDDPARGLQAIAPHTDGRGSKVLWAQGPGFEPGCWVYDLVNEALRKTAPRILMDAVHQKAEAILEDGFSARFERIVADPSEDNFRQVVREAVAETVERVVTTTMPDMSATELRAAIIETIPELSERFTPTMDGKKVFVNATGRMVESINEVLSMTGWSLDSVDLVLPHQANLRISEWVRGNMKIPEHKMYNNIDHIGNTTSCSIPGLLYEAMNGVVIEDVVTEDGRKRVVTRKVEPVIHPGMKVVMVVFGAGFTYGAAAYVA